MKSSGCNFSSRYVIFLISFFIPLLAHTAPIAPGVSTTPPSRLYEKNLKRFEIRTAPLAFLAKWLTLDTSYRLNDSFSTGPAVVIYAAGGPGGMLAPSFKGYAAGWSANYYINGAQEDTVYVGTHAYYESYDSYPHAFLGYYSRSGLRANITLGYQWRISSWMNMQAGAGLEARQHHVTAYPENASSSTAYGSESDDNTSGPVLEFKVGFEI